MIILALDPGKLTGVSLFDSANGRLGGAEVSPWQALVKTLHTTRMLGADIVCIERFDITSKTSKVTRTMDPLYIMGVVHYLTYLFNVPLKEYGRSQVKMFSNDTIRSERLWFKGGAGHCNDSRRVLLRALIEHHIDPKQAVQTAYNL